MWRWLSWWGCIQLRSAASDTDSSLQGWLYNSGTWLQCLKESSKLIFFKRCFVDKNLWIAPTRKHLLIGYTSFYWMCGKCVCVFCLCGAGCCCSCLRIPLAWCCWTNRVWISNATLSPSHQQRSLPPLTRFPSALRRPYYRKRLDRAARCTVHTFTHHFLLGIKQTTLQERVWIELLHLITYCKHTHMHTHLSIWMHEWVFVVCLFMMFCSIWFDCCLYLCQSGRSTFLKKYYQSNINVIKACLMIEIWEHETVFFLKRLLWFIWVLWFGKYGINIFWHVILWFLTSSDSALL